MIDTADSNQQVKLNLMNNSENVLGVILKRGISFYCNMRLINTILHTDQLSTMYISKKGHGQMLSIAEFKILTRRRDESS